MDNRIGLWNSGWYNGSGPWQKGYVVTGAYREDLEDVMYNYSIVTNTHFWDPADHDCDYNPENTKIHIWDYCYENACVKALNYWRGKKFANDDWLYITVPVLSGPGITFLNWYVLRLRYDDLGNAYRYNQIYVVEACRLSAPPIWIPYNPPEPLMNFNLQGGTRGRWENICWEIVGRICHLLGDEGVPAHAHNDIHPPYGGQGDMFESWMWDAGNYTDKNWVNAKQQAVNYNQPVLVDVLNAQYPLKFAFYTTNQLADRFPSDDYDGDAGYVPYWPVFQPPLLGDPIYMYLQNIYANLTTHTNKPPTLETMNLCTDIVYPFSMRSTGGFLWYVYNKFGITSNPPPIISSLTQTPSVLCNGTTATITCNLSQGGIISYTWTPANIPNGMSFSYNDNKAYITYNSSFSPNGANPPVNPFQITCFASNQYGSSTKTVEIIYNENCNGGSCPWISIYNADSFSYVTDNNILHRSEFSEFFNTNIIDLYKLNVTPSFIDNKCNIIIQETENDIDYYNYVKLFAVDHPEGTNIGVTENNDIVMYDDSLVISTDDAILNRNQNITRYIQYNYQGRKIVSGIEGDSIYAHYDSSSQMKTYLKFINKYKSVLYTPESDSIALIGEIGDNGGIGYPSVKDYAGNVTITTDTDVYEKLFSRRESISEIIIPFAENCDNVNNIDVTWFRDYEVIYFSVVPIMYSGFTISELNLSDAEHSENGQCIVDLIYEDSNYVNLDSSDIIKLWFEDIEPPAQGMLRDYVIKIDGRYNVNTDTSSGQNMLTLNTNNKILTNVPSTNKLYVNYPNPFNPKTNIKYDVAKNGLVKITVYDLLGRVVKVLENTYRKAGTYQIAFNGTNLASGIYIYKIETNDYFEAKKMVLIK